MKKKRKQDKWSRLCQLIGNYAAASVAESWKGGGDPASVETLEARLELTRAELNEHIATLRRDEE